MDRTPSPLAPPSIARPDSRPTDLRRQPLRAQQMQGIVRSLRVVYGAVQAHSHSIEQQYGVSAAQLWAMRELAERPGQKVTDLALTLNMHPANCSCMVDKLRKKGLLRKQRSGPDQRVVWLYLTGTGEELLANAPRSAQGVLLEALDRLPEPALVDLERSLCGLMGAIKGPPPAATARA